jgi:DNA repair protein RecO (recombination protein O)
MVEKEVIDEKINYFVKSASEKKIIPNFLIDKDDKNVDLKKLLKGLKLVTDYLEKSILKPNNLNVPSSRIHFVNLLK